MLAACARRISRLRATTCRASLRYMSTEEPQPESEPERLKTQHDWNDFQLRRAEQEVLGTF
jgi:hypothetical protein